MKTVAELGEDALVAALLARLPTVGRGVVVAPGQDDCAVVRVPGTKRWQLLKTDCVIEGVHFAPDTAPEAVGWKALCRPLSDLAATGGKPAYALVTMALRGDVPASWPIGVYEGLGRAAREYGVTVVGGETARTLGPRWLSVCLSGSVRRGRAVTRGGGQIGDQLYVTGQLGGSFPSGRHLTFQPRLAEARWLTKHFAIRAMMDLSDGLASDLPRMARASGTGFVVEPEKLPRADGCSPAQALGDGEDYELLFAVKSEDAAKLERAWKKRWPQVRLTSVGELAQARVAKGLGNAKGYDHFVA